jgi:hypothetical protein
LQRAAGGKPFIAIDFKGAHCPKSVIVHAVFFYVRYAVSYRDLEGDIGRAWCGRRSRNPKPMGREIFTVNSRKCPGQEAAYRCFLAGE